MCLERGCCISAARLLPPEGACAVYVHVTGSFKEKYFYTSHSLVPSVVAAETRSNPTSSLIHKSPHYSTLNKHLQVSNTELQSHKCTSLILFHRRRFTHQISSMCRLILTSVFGVFYCFSVLVSWFNMIPLFIKDYLQYVFYWQTLPGLMTKTVFYLSISFLRPDHRFLTWLRSEVSCSRFRHFTFMITESLYVFIPFLSDTPLHRGRKRTAELLLDFQDKWFLKCTIFM